MDGATERKQFVMLEAAPSVRINLAVADLSIFNPIKERGRFFNKRLVPLKNFSYSCRTSRGNANQICEEVVKFNIRFIVVCAEPLLVNAKKV